MNAEPLAAVNTRATATKPRAAKLAWRTVSARSMEASTAMIASMSDIRRPTMVECFVVEGSSISA